MNRTGIEWTNFSANPLKYRDADGKVVWGCIKCSSGCANCYSEALANRFGRGGPFTAKTMEGLTPFLDEAELRRMLTYKPASGKRCFVGDMTDVFGEWVPDELLDQLFAVFAMRSDVTWQVLTKRAERMPRWFAGINKRRCGYWCEHAGYLHDLAVSTGLLSETVAGEQHAKARRHWNPDLPDPPTSLGDSSVSIPWPLPNVWLGVSVENQEQADKRIPLLLKTPAAVRFLSMEPLLGPVDLSRWLLRTLSVEERNAIHDATGGMEPYGIACQRAELANQGIGWVIVGGESGHGARPMHPDWARSLRDQCLDADTPFFFKQWGEWAPAETAPDPEPVPTTILKGSPCETVVMRRPPVGLCWVDRDGPVKIIDEQGKFTGQSPRGQAMHRVGKKAAGRLLDGREWSEFPVVEVPHA